MKISTAVHKGTLRFGCRQALGTLALLAALPFTLRAAEPQKIAMTPDHWEIKGDAQFLRSDGSAPADDLVKVTTGHVLLKDVTFRDGTIEFDVQPNGNMGAGIAFHYRDENTYEDFYLRPRPQCDQVPECIQYAPTTKGVLLWDLFPQFQVRAPLKDGVAWNHVRMVISGKRMNIYINGVTQPTLKVGHLEGDATEGSIFLQGPGTFANLVITPNATSGLAPAPEPDATDSDWRLVRNWQLSAWTTLDLGKDPAYVDLPMNGWSPIHAERDGLINISRVYGLPTARKTRTLAWLKTTVMSDKAQSKKVDLAEVREAWVFVNGKLVFSDKSIETRNNLDRRLLLDNGSFDLPLQAGKNEIVVASTTQYFGWGIKMRLADIEGIKLIESKSHPDMK